MHAQAEVHTVHIFVLEGKFLKEGGCVCVWRQIQLEFISVAEGCKICVHTDNKGSYLVLILGGDFPFPRALYNR